MIRIHTFPFRFVVPIIAAFAFFVIGSGSAHAAPVVDRIPDGTMPSYVEAYLLDCGGTNGAVAQTGWVSLRGNPTVTVVEVNNYTTTTIDLQYNVAGIVCRANAKGGIVSTTNGIIATTPSNLNIAGLSSTYTYGNSNGDYTLGDPILFTYTSPTPFTVSTDISVAINEKRINTYSVNPRNRCVTNPGDVNIRAPLSNIDFAACRSSATPVFTLRVNVPPPGNPPQGTIDIATCDTWSGWAFDRDRSSDSIAVHIYLNAPAGTPGAVFVGEFMTSVNRSDVNATFGISGNHGFEIPVPAAYKNSAATVYAYAIGLDTAGNRDGINAYLGTRSYDPCPVAPQTSCNVTGFSVVAGGSGAASVTIRHNGPALAPTINYSGTLTLQGVSDSLTGILANGASVTRSNTTQVFPAPGSYTASASFDITSSAGNTTISCSGVVTVTLPPPQINCSVLGAAIEQGSSTIVQVTINHLGPQYAPDVAFSATVQIVSQPTEALTSTVQNLNSRILTSTSRTYPNAGRYAVTVLISGTGGPYAVSTNCSGTITVSSRPYVRTYGNDVHAGSGFGTDCSIGAGSVLTFNRGSSANFAGSGGQLGTFARGPIQGFRSASMRPDSTILPYALSFSNTLSNNPAGSLFGGLFGQRLCAPDYWSGSQTATARSDQTINLAAFTASGRYVYTQSNPGIPVTITGILPAGVKITIYIDGNVVITNGPRVGYGDGPWGSIATIPSLYVVSRGNIGIASNVTTLDGQYVAQHTDTTRGRINTCIDPTSLTFYSSDSALITNCRNRLTVNGTFSAFKVNFLRLVNTTLSAVPGEPASTSNAAEVFVFSPEVYLGIQPTVGASPQTYDSITALPPSL